MDKALNNSFIFVSIPLLFLTTLMLQGSFLAHWFKIELFLSAFIVILLYASLPLKAWTLIWALIINEQLIYQENHLMSIVLISLTIWTYLTSSYTLVYSKVLFPLVGLTLAILLKYTLRFIFSFSSNFDFATMIPSAFYSITNSAILLTLVLIIAYKIKNYAEKQEKPRRKTGG